MQFEQHFIDFPFEELTVYGAMTEDLRKVPYFVTTQRLDVLSEQSLNVRIPGQHQNGECFIRVLVDEVLDPSHRELAEVILQCPQFRIDSGVLAIFSRDDFDLWEAIADWTGIPIGDYQIELLSLERWSRENYQLSVPDRLSPFDKWCHYKLPDWIILIGAALWFMLLLSSGFVVVSCLFSKTLWSVLLFLAWSVSFLFVLPALWFSFWEWVPWLNRYRKLRNKFLRDYPSLIVSLRSVSQTA